jgi:hypothetical protein
VDEAVDVIEALVLLTEDDDCVADGEHSVAGRVKLLALAYTTQLIIISKTKLQQHRNHSLLLAIGITRAKGCLPA